MCGLEKKERVIYNGRVTEFKIVRKKDEYLITGCRKKMMKKMVLSMT